MSQTPKNRGQFTSSLGFILASAGSAIGLGNLWKFPYIAANSGGGIFLVFYILFVLLLGVPIMMAEMSIGRRTQLNAIGAYRKLNKKWTFVGVLGVLCAFVILSYYSVVGGWVTKYIVAFASGGNFGSDPAAYFNNFVASPVEPVVWHLVFMAFCAIVVVMGVVKGIEKMSKILLPALFVIVVVVAIRSVTLPGAGEGLKFLFVPDFSAVSSIGDLGNAMVQAMGQVFFSLSLGMGITITYGSYLKKESNIVKDTGIVVGLDSLAAILSGCAILPAVFALGFEPTAGPGLIFSILPAVFADMPFGAFFGFLFFILVFIAAATSAISLLEVVAAYFIDNFHWSRKKATIIMASLMAFIGIFASLSMGPLSNVLIGGMNIFDALSFFTDKLLMPISAMLMCVFVGHVWGTDALMQELVIGSPSAIKLKKVLSVILKYIAPILILVILITGLLPA